jgi:glycosyltransferase involved in cell wall biosynthesis
MSDRGKILHAFSTFDFGGPQRRFAEYLKLSDSNFEHKIIAMDNNYKALAFTDGLSAPENAPDIPTGATCAATRVCRKHLKQVGPDLLVTYNWGATEWVLANKYFPICPMIHIQDGFGTDEQSAEISRRRKMRSFAYKACHKVVVPSRQLKRLAEKSWKISPKKLQLIPNGIDTEKFNLGPNETLISANNIHPKNQVIGTVAGLRPEKNIGRLIEAFSIIEDSHDNCQLVIVGDGVGLPALKMLAERVCRKGSVIFTGNLAAPEDIIPRFDIFALSSDTEQMPLSVIEAMAAAKPIVSTDVGDISHMVSSENQPYIAGKEAATLADNLLGLLAAPAQIKAIGQANQTKAVDEYDVSKMVAAYDDLFTKVMD